MISNQYTEQRKNKGILAKELGGNPYAHTATKGVTNKEFLELEPTKDIFSVTGRVILARKMGKSGFLKIKDESGILQVFCSLESLQENFAFFKNVFDIGDIIQVEGYAFHTQTGELTVHATKLSLLTKSLLPLPEKWNGLEDVETRYRKRYLDMISNAEVLTTFQERSRIISSIRSFMLTFGALEVETPMLNPIPGGANAKPFITHHNALSVDRYLRIAPELYLKRLIVGGLEKVFEIGKNFRNEGIDATHNPEFTSMEFYFAYKDYSFLKDYIQEMISLVSKDVIEFNDKTIDMRSWTSIPFKQALVSIGNVPEQILDDTAAIYAFLKENGVKVKPGLSLGKLWEELFDEYVEEKLVNPTFITEYPVDISPLAKRKQDDPSLTERFELFIAGMEIANGFSELNDPEDQYERFLSQVATKDNDDEAMFLDSDYVEALMYGMPPTAGAGIGIDRLVMLLTNNKSIKDVIAFPAMK